MKASLDSDNELSGSTSRSVTRILEQYPDVRQVRLDPHNHTVHLGFYRLPSDDVLSEIESAVLRDLSGEWSVQVQPPQISAEFHQHLTDDGTTEFHRVHPIDEPKVIWKRIRFPTWRNRPVPPSSVRDYRIMLLLAVVCGLSTFTGFLFQRAGYAPAVITAGLSFRRQKLRNVSDSMFARP